MDAHPTCIGVGSYLLRVFYSIDRRVGILCPPILNQLHAGHKCPQWLEVADLGGHECPPYGEFGLPLVDWGALID